MTDESGAVLPGVTVTITDEARGIARVVTTSETGVFVVPALRMGFYTVTVELLGFQTFVTDKVEVGSGQTTDMPITLSIASIAETVTVTSAYGPGTHRPIKAPVGKASSPVTTYRVAAQKPDRHGAVLHDRIAQLSRKR